MSSVVTLTPATMPSTTATNARPCDSPAVIHRNTRPIFPRRGIPDVIVSSQGALQQQRIHVPAVLEAHAGQPSGLDEAAAAVQLDRRRITRVGDHRDHLP